MTRVARVVLLRRQFHFSVLAFVLLLGVDAHLFGVRSPSGSGAWHAVLCPTGRPVAGARTLMRGYILKRLHAMKN